MEMIDIVTPQGCSTGISLPRDEVHRNGALKLQKEEVEEVCRIPLASLKNRVHRKDPRLVSHPAIYTALFQYFAHQHPTEKACSACK